MKCTKCGKETENNSEICNDCRQNLITEKNQETNPGKENERIFIGKKKSEFDKATLIIEKLKIKPQRVVFFKVILVIFEVILYLLGIISIILLIQSYKITVSDIFEVVGIDPSKVSYLDGKEIERVISIIRGVAILIVIVDLVFAIMFTYSRKQTTRVIKQNRSIKRMKEIISDIFDYFHKA